MLWPQLEAARDLSSKHLVPASQSKGDSTPWLGLQVSFRWITRPFCQGYRLSPLLLSLDTRASRPITIYSLILFHWAYGSPVLRTVFTNSLMSIQVSVCHLIFCIHSMTVLGHYSKQVVSTYSSIFYGERQGQYHSYPTTLILSSNTDGICRAGPEYPAQKVSLTL